MRIHFIAIGGSAMHNLAIALHKKGFKVTGSDDVIFEPSSTRLANYGLLPKSFGWFEENITDDLFYNQYLKIIDQISQCTKEL